MESPSQQETSLALACVDILAHGVGFDYVVCKDVDFLATKKCYLARVLTSYSLALKSNSKKAKATPTRYPLFKTLATMQASRFSNIPLTILI